MAHVFEVEAAEVGPPPAVDVIALVGGNGWSTVPVAFSNSDGTFRVTNGSIGAPGYDASPEANGGVQPKVLVGDFNNDGYTDMTHMMPAAAFMRISVVEEG